MEANPVLAGASSARIISLEDRRRARRAARRQSASSQPLVALWFAAAGVAGAAAIWLFMSVALRHGLVGLTMLLALGTAVAWPAAGRWLSKNRAKGIRKASQGRHPSNTRRR